MNMREVWRKRAGFRIGVVFLAVMGIWSFSGEMQKSDQKRAGSITVTAHRGAAWTAPENTMAAVKNAVNQLSDYVEIDVQETRDGVLVLLHDANLKRTTGLDREIWTVDYEEIENLDAGGWFQEAYEGETIPRLDQVLEYCRGKLLVNVEIKDNGHNEGIVKSVIQTIKDYDMLEQCVLSSMNYEFLCQAKELEPELVTGYILAEAGQDMELLQAADFVSVKYTCVTEEFVQKAHACGKEVHVWTVNSPGQIRRMILLQVDNLITDLPQMAAEVLEEESRL
ncbi:MAG: hypothetical protein IJ036_05100 [Lachnospiraceae bacterium]|nr:hypothetical protein [Lachnospiraceae bacterium]